MLCIRYDKITHVLSATQTMMERLKSKAPGIRGITIDSVLRGKHIAALSRHGIHVINHPHAKSNPNAAKQGRFAPGREERIKHVRTLVHQHPHHTHCEHPILLNGGQVCQEILNAEGNCELQPLRHTGLKTQTLHDNTTVSRVSYELTCRDTTLTLYLRLDKAGTNEYDTARAESARLYPVGSHEFNTIYGWRNRSESVHARIKNTMPRVPAYGKNRQTLFILGTQLINNVVSNYMWPTPDPPT